MKSFPHHHVLSEKKVADITVAAALDIIIVLVLEHHHVLVRQVLVIVDVQKVDLDLDRLNVAEDDRRVAHLLDPHTDDPHKMIDAIRTRKEEEKGIKIDIHLHAIEALAIIHLVTGAVSVIEVVIGIVVAKIGVAVIKAVKEADVVIVIGDKGEINV